MLITLQRLPSHPTLGMLQDPIAQNAFDTWCTTLLIAFYDTSSVSPITKQKALFTTAAQNLHQWSECHAMSSGQDDVWTNPVNDAKRGSRGGGRNPDPSPWKITNSIGLYRNMQLDPLPLGKVGTPGNV